MQGEKCREWSTERDYTVVGEYQHKVSTMDP
jgi:hypothetical protein